MSDQSVGIVGGGIVGLAVARELTKRRPGLQVTVFEKEPRLATHQTGHNSGVVHAGIYYKPGSLKARLCARGRGMIREYCQEHGLPFDECGKLVVAVSPDELGRLDALEATAGRNEVPGLRRIDGSEIADIEPHTTGLAALHSPHTAITDYDAIARRFGEDITESGGTILTATEVTGLQRRAGGVEVVCGAQTRRVDLVVACAGLFADRVARWGDGQRGPRIVPFRGEYMTVRPDKRDLVNGLVYPVPDPRYPFLGVHFTRRVSGELEIGPNAVLALRREGYRRRDIGFADLRGTVSWPGFWQLARRHWRTGVTEMRGSLSTRAYMKAARRYVPDIGAPDVVRGAAGVRAQAVERDGTLVDDFVITGDRGITSVRNAPSPAATSSLAIAEYVVDRLEVPT